MQDCIFCKIIAKEIPSKPVFETQDVLAIADLHPQAPTHILIMPKKHVASLNDLSSSDRSAILPKLYEVADTIAREKGVREKGYRTVINNQRGGGQSVFHLHLHLLAGKTLEESAL